jgi:hypothetical protein
LRPFIDLQNEASLDGFLQDLAAPPPVALAVGVVSLLVALKPPRFTTHVSPLLVAIVTGTVLPHSLALVLAPSALSGTLVSVVPKLPDLDILRGLSRTFHDPEMLAAVPGLLLPALSLALLATLERLLTMSAIDGMLPGRQSTDRELLAQGAANVVSSCFGGLPSAAGMARCSNNARGGARSRVAALANDETQLGRGLGRHDLAILNEALEESGRRRAQARRLAGARRGLRRNVTARRPAAFGGCIRRRRHDIPEAGTQDLRADTPGPSGTGGHHPLQPEPRNGAPAALHQSRTAGRTGRRGPRNTACRQAAEAPDLL